MASLALSTERWLDGSPRFDSSQLPTTAVSPGSAPGEGEKLVPLDGRDDLTALSRAFSTMAARAREREAHLSAALHRERVISRTLQTAFVPQSLPDCPGYALAAAYHPALGEAEVGGDFYDAFRLPGDRIGLLLGDVAGKGVGAAVYASMARYMARAYALQCEAPAEVMARVNDALCDSIEDPGVFVTAFYAVLEPATGVLRGTAAGHWPAVLVRRQAEEVGGGRSLALGICPGAAYQEFSLELQPGEGLLMYTDGLVEIGTDDPMEHLAQVRALVSGRRRESPQHWVNRLHADALRRSGGLLRDDLTLLALRRERRS
jgi:serine phosphatase RsbU (regulator of sigma subunit)